MSQPTWIGRTLSGRYHIDELLGQGGMSAVYKATDPNLQRVVAIKIIHSHLSGDPDFIKRFEREAAAVAHLRHSNIIQVYDFNHDGDAYYIVFEYIAGVTLQDRLKKLNELHQQMPAGEAIDIAVGLGEAVHYAHKQGLVHRDIKPANVMLNSRNEPILMDFGIAKIVGGAKHTATGATLGTAQYMSPEQIKGEAIDARTDIYALGITLFEMLGGRSPFDADSTMAVMMMHVQNPVPDLRDIRRDVPVDVVMILKKAMAKEPDGRYQNAAQFVEALRNVRLNLPTEEVTWVGGGVTAVEDRTIVKPVPPINPTQKIDPPKGVTIVDAQPIPEQYVPVLLPSQQYPVQRRSKSKFLAPVFAILLLALIAAGVWFAFFRGPSVDDLLAQADTLAAAGQYDEAISIYDDILENIDPGNSSAQSGLKMALRSKVEAEDQAGDYIQVEADLQQILQLDPNDAEINLLMAQNLEKQGRLTESLPYYEKALAIDQDLTQARIGLGWAYYNIDDYDQALTTFTDLVNLHPADAAGYEGQGKSYYALEWYEDAVSPFNKWVDLDQTSAESYQWLGMTYDKLNNYRMAEANYRQWLELAIGTEMENDARLNLAWSTYNNAKYEESLELFMAAKEAEPELPSVYEGLGAVYTKLEDWEDAAEANAKWVELEPQNTSAYSSLGWSYYILNQFESAAESFKSALGLDDTNFTAYRGLGHVEYGTGNYKSAIENYSKWIEYDPENDNAYTSLGWSYFNNGQFSEALDTFLKALSLNPDSGRAYQGAGNVYEQFGDGVSATNYYRRWAELSTGEYQPYAKLGWVLFELEEYEDAIDAFDQVVFLDPENSSGYKGLAYSYKQLQNGAMAYEYQKLWAEWAPSDPEAHTQLGWSLYTQQDFGAAIEAFSAALNLDPQNYSALSGRGQAYYYSVENGCEQAIPDFEAALEIRPGDERMTELLTKCES